ncbi:MAG: IclR family transcriptional regulator [Kutzneria sp.]|nr:IclR family transcriptional regulator [Kutzneria sp.]
MSNSRLSVRERARPSHKRQHGSDAASQVQSVDRALTILRILAQHGELGVTDIAGELAVHKSTAFRLLGALERHQLVEQLVERGKYRLAAGLVRLAGAATARLDLAEESRPVCRELAATLNETVNVAVLDTDAAMNITQDQGNAAVAVQNWIGQRTPLHATSSGKILLAWASGGERTAILGRRLDRFTPNTVTSRTRLRTELSDVRKRGWACTAEELEVGLNAVAAPIRDRDGTVVAAVSASGPSYRLRTESFAAVAETLREGADEISGRLGYVPGP